jgi:hypothetical protein
MGATTGMSDGQQEASRWKEEDASGHLDEDQKDGAGNKPEQSLLLVLHVRLHSRVCE